MTKLVSVIIIMACLLVLSACETTIIPMLDVPDQSMEDGEVNINVAIDAAGWLVLHPATEAGEPDTSEDLSRSYLAAAGEWTDADNAIQVTVPLLVGGERIIFARLYYDDPTDRKFDPSSDNSSDPPVSVASGIVQDSFTVPGLSPYIEIEQSTTTGKVSFTVGIDAPGWLILRPETTEGEPDTSIVLVRARFPEAGQSTFSVTLPSTIEEGITIYALLYYDDPLDEEFTYTTDGVDDLPVQVDGIDVIESFEVDD
jgi:hypothetical protein